MAQSGGSGGSKQDRGYLGPALEYWRDGEAVSNLVQALGQLGFSLTEQQYVDAEAGTHRPKPLADFIGAVTTHYGLESVARRDLEHRIAFDILYARLGARTTLVLSEPPADYPPAQDPDQGVLPPTTDTD